ncbi:hypothetical protein M3Y94_00613700 [Aphelenchoides besseyi]|nr:hypothetical protein M3Y94_00613700 [Aphelenchoides besseyi]KAI6216328.1 hypothetical protein M3Y95_01283400 [Aphelenchoides besseyi]
MVDQVLSTSGSDLNEMADFASNYLDIYESAVNKKNKSKNKWSGNLEDFEIQERLGYSWYGDIFSITNRRQGNISCMLKTTRIFPSIQWRLRLELAALAELKHENLIEVKRAFVRYGVLFTVLPLHVNVEDIVNVLKPSNVLSNILPVTLSTTMRMPVLGTLIRQLYRAVTYLHGNELVHLDLKPANLVLTENGVLKLCDLAVSQQLASFELHDLHRLAEPKRFVAPEVAAYENFDCRADTWCFALCCIQLAFGLQPFETVDIELNGTIMPLVFATNEKEVPLETIYRHGQLLERSMPPAMLSFVRACLIGRADRRPTLNELRRHEFIRGCMVVPELLVEELMTDSLRHQYQKQRAIAVKQQTQQLVNSMPHTSWIEELVSSRLRPSAHTAVIHIIGFEPQSSHRRELKFPVSLKLKNRLLDEVLRHRLFDWLDDQTFSLHNFYQLATKVLCLFSDYKQRKDERFFRTTLAMHPDPKCPDVEVDRRLNKIRGHEYVYLVYIVDAQWAGEAAEWLKSTEHFLIKAGYCKAEGLMEHVYHTLLQSFKKAKPSSLAF